jgi:hypothetical protein
MSLLPGIVARRVQTSPLSSNVLRRADVPVDAIPWC